MQSYQFKTALLIDDNEVDMMIHTKLIKHLSLFKQIVTKCSAMEALEFITHELASFRTMPEIIFLDINMPLMNGFEFLEQLEKLPSVRLNKTKIIMLSSTLDKEEIKKMKDHPYIHHFICKPLTLTALMQVLEVSLPTSN